MTIVKLDKVDLEREIRKLLRNNKMGKLAEVAARLQKAHQDNEAIGDDLMAKMDEIDKLRPLAAARAKAFIAEKRADIEEIEASLRALSNLPLTGSGEPPKE